MAETCIFCLSLFNGRKLRFGTAGCGIQSDREKGPSWAQALKDEPMSAKVRNQQHLTKRAQHAPELAKLSVGLLFP